MHFLDMSLEAAGLFFFSPEKRTEVTKVVPLCTNGEKKQNKKEKKQRGVF